MTWMALLGAQAQTDTSRHKKVALVLSGGGAKGVAHIGVLKVLERAGLQVDIITGTSMGSLVGGMYACGNSAERLDSLVRAQDWTTVFSDKDDLRYQSLKEREDQNKYVFSTSLRFNKKSSRLGGGFIIGKNISRLLYTFTSPYNDSIDFNTLPIPFACVATNAVDNTEYVFHSGVLSEAMRASMSIPGAFSPVRKDDYVFVDGGLRNNYPADVAKEMGADYIIGVTVNDKMKSAKELTSTSDIVMQLIGYACVNKYSDNLAITDIPIRVNTEGYTSASFSASAIDTLIRRGEEAAMAHWDEIVALKEKLQPIQPKPRLQIYQKPMSVNPSYKIGALLFENMSPTDEHYIRTKFKLREGDSIDTERANLITTSIRLDLLYESASFQIERDLVQSPDGSLGARVRFMAGDKKSNRMRVGIRFDNEEIVALQTNIAFPIRKRLPMQLDFNLRLGKRILTEANWELHPTNFLRPTVTVAFRRNDINLYEYGDRSYDLTYNRFTAMIAPLRFDVRNFHISIGAAFDYYFNYKLLLDQVNDHYMELPKHEHFISYQARADYNNENEWYFPTKGTRFFAKFGYYTDNFAQLDGNTGLSEVSAMWRTAVPLSNHFTLQPMLYCRLLHSKNTPVILSNIMGGEWFGHYLEQQMPFAGMGHIELMWDKVLSAQLQLQYSLTKSHIFLLRFAIDEDDDKYKNLFSNRPNLGASLSYYYNTLSGPAGVSVGYSNITKEPYFYVNLGFVF